MKRIGDCTQINYFLRWFEIKCPECGGHLQYWKEYIVTKTQMITFGGEISKRVINTKPDAMDDMQGFECVVCGWIFNNAQDVELDRKYPHFEKWLKDHEDENLLDLLFYLFPQK